MHDYIRITNTTTDGFAGRGGRDHARIVCSFCSMECTHLHKVVVGARGEDGPARVTQVNAHTGEIQQAHRDEEDCPGRRDWTELHFTCENGHDFVLVLLQHKGDTLVSVLAE